MTINEAKEKLLAVARSEIGYKEGYNNYIKYAESNWDNQFYGWELQHQPWCDVFVDYCFTTAFGMQDGAAMTYQVVGRGSALCMTSAEYYRNNGAFFDTPEVGDQVFFYVSGAINHTGIVESVANPGPNWTSITTIEGNAADMVQRLNHPRDPSYIAGFGRPKWSIVAESSTPIITPKPVTPLQLQAGDKVKVMPGATYYNTSIKVPQFVLNDTWIVLSVSGDRVVINLNVSGTNHIMSPIYKKYLVVVATASAPATQPEAQKYRYYTVKRNDSLWGIAARELGSGLRFGEIKKLNNLTSNLLKPGQILKLPSD